MLRLPTIVFVALLCLVSALSFWAGSIVADVDAASEVQHLRTALKTLALCETKSSLLVVRRPDGVEYACAVDGRPERIILIRTTDQ